MCIMLLSVQSDSDCGVHRRGQEDGQAADSAGSVPQIAHQQMSGLRAVQEGGGECTAISGAKGVQRDMYVCYWCLLPGACCSMRYMLSTVLVHSVWYLQVCVFDHSYSTLSKSYITCATCLCASFSFVAIHGDKSQESRTSALEEFKSAR